MGNLPRALYYWIVFQCGNVTGAVVSAAVSEAEKTASVPAVEISEAPELARMENDSTHNSTGQSAERVIYFSFDHSDIDNNYGSIIQAHAKYFANHANVHVGLEAYDDEHGTRECDTALSEHRNDSLLVLLTSARIAIYVLAAADRLATCADENSIDQSCRDGPHDSYNTLTILDTSALVVLHRIVQPGVQRMPVPATPLRFHQSILYTDF